MTDTYTDGRPMSRRLQDALDRIVDASDLRVMLAVLDAGASDADSRLGPLYAGLAVELRLNQLREADVMAALEADHRAELDALDPHPMPPPAGRTWYPLGGGRDDPLGHDTPDPDAA